MFIIKLLTSLILPPGIFICLLTVIGIYCWKKKNKPVSFSLFIIAVMFYLHSIGPFSNALVGCLEEKYYNFSKVKTGGAKYIVVLGGGLNPSSPGEDGKPELSDSALKRVIKGFKLYKKYRLPIILSGGRVLRKDVLSEAEVAQSLLLELGVPEKKILLESKSRNTYENAKEIENKYAPGSIYLVTSAWHMPRAMACFNKPGLEAVPVPADFKSSLAPVRIYNFFPSASALRTSSLALHEYAGIIYYSIRYGL